MIDILKAAAIGVACGSILTMLYVAVKNQWPENYFQLDGTADPVVSRNMTRYGLFRFLPPFLIFGAAAVTADRLAVSPVLAVTISVLVHSKSLITAILSAVRRRARLRLAAARAGVVLILSFLGLAATRLRGSLDSVVPTPADLLSNLWAGALAAVGAVFLQRVALVKHDPLSIAIKSTRTIRGANFRYAEDAARAASLPAELIYIFMVAEDVQRPRWMRWLEFHLPGRRHRTTGIMQQRGAKSDFESIDLAVQNYFIPAVAKVESEGGEDAAPEYKLHQSIDEAAAHYNEDPSFQALISGLSYNLVADDTWNQIIRSKLHESNE